MRIKRVIKNKTVAKSSFPCTSPPTQCVESKCTFYLLHLTFVSCESGYLPGTDCNNNPPHMYVSISMISKFYQQYKKEKEKENPTTPETGKKMTFICISYTFTTMCFKQKYLLFLHIYI